VEAHSDVGAIFIKNREPDRAFRFRLRELALLEQCAAKPGPNHGQIQMFRRQYGQKPAANIPQELLRAAGIAFLEKNGPGV